MKKTDVIAAAKTAMKTRVRPDRLLFRGHTSTTVDLNYVAHELEAAVVVQTQQRFGMELHRLDRQFAVAHAHDDAVFGFRGDFEARRELLRIANSE